jgi:branched-chain amino acid transport system permease protein
MVKYRPWIAFVVLIIAAPLLLRTCASALLGRAILVGIFTILVIGFDLAVGYGGQINLGFQGFFAVGAYTTALLTTRTGIPAILSEPLAAMLSGCIVSVIICYVISRPVLRTGGFFLAMVTLAFGMVVYTLTNGWDFLGGASGITGVPRFHVGPLVFGTDLWYCYAVWAFALLSIVLSLRMIHSRWGIALRAVHSDEIAAEVTGINVSKYKMEVFLISAIYASVAGSLFAHHLRGVNPPMFTFTLLLLVTLAIFFGGMGTIWGGLVGAALVQSLPEGVTALTSYWPWMRDTRELLYGIIFILIILFMPEGVFGRARKVLLEQSDLAGRKAGGLRTG